MTTNLTEAQIVLLSASCFAALLAIIVKVVQHKEVFDKLNVSSRLLLCLAVSDKLDLIGASGWLLQVWIRACPLLMLFNFFGYKSAALFCNSVGLQLVSKIQSIEIREWWFFVVPYSLTCIMVFFILGLHTYMPLNSPIEKCWFTPLPGLILSRVTDFIIFGINALLFGYTTYRLVRSRHEFAYNTDKMKGKERRLYFILACFFVRTCFSMLSLAPNEKISDIAILAMCVQGLLNAAAMNEKEIQTFFYHLYKYRSRSPPAPPPRCVTPRKKTEVNVTDSNTKFIDHPQNECTEEV